MEELTEEELAALDESMDTDAMMKALQEAFMGVQSGTGFIQESDDEEDEDEWDDDQSTAVKDIKKGRKFDLGNLDEAEAKSFEKLEGTKPMKTVGKKGLAEDEDTEGDEALEEGDVIKSITKDANGNSVAHAGPKAVGNSAEAIKARQADGNKPAAIKEEELDEASQRTLANGKNQTLKPQTFPKDKKRSGINESKNLMTKLSEKVEAVLAENARLKSENKEMATLNEGLETKFTAAAEKLQEVKGKLYEASIIASKSTCMNKLMLEHVTTQDEKINIVESFQKASSRAEVQNLFEKFDKSFKKGGSAQLNEGKNPLSKLNPLFKSETNTQEVLNEGTVYDNAFTAKMDRLIGYNGKK